MQFGAQFRGWGIMFSVLALHAGKTLLFCSVFLIIFLVFFGV